MKTFIYILLGLLLCQFSYAQTDGQLDQSFGSSGFSYVNSKPSTAEYMMDVISLANDKILVGGYINQNSWDIHITRLNKNGIVDLGFGNNGFITTDLDDGSSDQVKKLLELPNGKIIVVGHSYKNQVQNAFIMRLNADGSLDKSFGEGSKGYTYFNAGMNTSCSAEDVEFYNGSFFVVATTRNSEGSSDFSLFKFTQGGVLDQSFAKKGSNLVDFGGAENVQNFAISSKGEFLLGGVSHKDGIQYGALLKLNSYGLVTSSFGNKGQFTYDDGSKLNTIIDVAFDKKNRMIAVGSEGKNPDKNGKIFRFLNDGTPDSSFASDGVIGSDIGVTNGVFLNAVIVEEDNSILALGYLSGPNYKDVYVLKLDEQGRPHDKFGKKGSVNHEVSLKPSYLFFKAAAMQSDGNLVLAGTTTIDGYDAFNMTVARIHNTEGTGGTNTVSETIENDIVTVFPNPSRESVSFKLPNSENAELKIFDQVGKQLLSMRFNEMTTLSTSEFRNPGVYFYTVRSQGVLTSGRFVVLK